MGLAEGGHPATRRLRWLRGRNPPGTESGDGSQNWQQAHCRLQLVGFGPSALSPPTAVELSPSAGLLCPSAQQDGTANRNWREDQVKIRRKAAARRPICLTGPIKRCWAQDGLVQMAGPPQWRCNVRCDGLAAISEAAGCLFHSRKSVETCGMSILRCHLGACHGASSSKPLRRLQRRQSGMEG
jgi:hypothetical protein